MKLPRRDSRELAQVALRHRLILFPGPQASTLGRYERFLRIPFLADPESLRTGVKRLSGAWRDYQSNGQPRSNQPDVVV